MVEIKDNQVFCCGKNIGKLENKGVYFCPICETLISIEKNPQKTLDNYNKKR